MEGKENQDDAASSAKEPEGRESPGGKEKHDGADSSSKRPGGRLSLGETSSSAEGVEDEAQMADDSVRGFLEYIPEGVETPGTSAVMSEVATPDGAATPEGSVSSSSLDTEESRGSRAKKKTKRKKRLHHGRATLNTRPNILRDPYHVCLGRPFKGEDNASANLNVPGKDHVVAFVTSTSVDALKISPSVIAAEKVAQQEVDLVKENVTLNGLLSDLIECLKLDHELRMKSKDNDQPVRRPNGIIKPAAKRKELSFDIPETNPTSAISPKLGTEAKARELFSAESSLRTPWSPIKLQEPQVPCPQPHPGKDARLSPVSGIELGQDKSGGDDDKQPETPAALATFQVHKVSLEERPSDGATAAAQVDEEPLIFFSSSLTDSSERQQLADHPFKGSSGYAGDSEAESFGGGRGCLEAAFGAGSFSEECGLAWRSPKPDRDNTHSGSSIADGEREVLGCWHELFQPIKMVSKYIQTDCWNEPASESSTRDQAHAPVAPRLKTTTNSLQKACLLQTALPHRRTTSAHSEASSTEELQKIFSAYSSSSARADESGRVKGMLHDRNFSMTSSGSAGKSGPDSASIAQPSTFDGGPTTTTADVPNRAGVSPDIEDALKSGH